MAGAPGPLPSHFGFEKHDKLLLTQCWERTDGEREEKRGEN